MRDGLRIFLFVLFFGVGIAAFYLSITCDELIAHYKNSQALAKQEKTTEVLKSLISDYEYRLARVKSDPNFANRMAPSVLGYERQNSEAIYPELTEEQLERAKRALAKSTDNSETQIEIPLWLARVSDPLKQKVLFVSGTLLILISLVWFVWVKKEAPKENE